MRIFGEVIGMIFLLILVYLFVRNAYGSVAVINAISQNAIAAIRTLQGR